MQVLVFDECTVLLLLLIAEHVGLLDGYNISPEHAMSARESRSRLVRFQAALSTSWATLNELMLVNV